MSLESIRAKLKESELAIKDSDLCNSVLEYFHSTFEQGISVDLSDTLRMVTDGFERIMNAEDACAEDYIRVINAFEREIESDKRLSGLLYDLRLQRLFVPPTSLLTAEAFSWILTDLTTEKELQGIYGYLQKFEHWVRDRQRILAAELVSMEAKAKLFDPYLRMNGTPTLVLMRGNSGSGKSTFLREAKSPNEAANIFIQSSIHKAAQELELPTDYAVINPDSLKYQLRKKTIYKDDILLNSRVHLEGSALTGLLELELINNGISFVSDRRYLSWDDIEVLRKPAMENDYAVVIVDMATPFNICWERVRQRPVNGPDPALSRDEVKDGALRASNNRKNIQHNAAAQGIEYYLVKYHK